MTEWLVAGVSGTATRRCQVGEQERSFTSSSPGLHHARCTQDYGELDYGELDYGELAHVPIHHHQEGWMAD